MKTKKIDFKQADFEQGCYYANIGETQAENTAPSTHADHTKCIRSKALIPMMSGRRIEMTLPVSNVRFKLFEYDESEKCIGSQERTGGGPYDLMYNTCYVLIQLYKTDLSAFAPTNVENYVGGWLSMCERVISFGTLDDGSVFTKGRNLLPDTIITDEIVNKLSKTANITDFSRIQNLWNNLGDYLYWKIPAGITDQQYVSGHPGNGTLSTSKTPSGRIVLVPDVTYVYSFWVEPSKSIPVNSYNAAHIQCVNIDGNPVGNTDHQETTISFNVSSAPADVWTKVVRKFKVKTPSVFTPYFLTVEPDLTMRIAQIKLEIGDEATDYSPAPEDFVNRVCDEYDRSV